MYSTAVKFTSVSKYFLKELSHAHQKHKNRMDEKMNELKVC